MENKNDTKEINLLQLLNLIGNWLVKLLNSIFGFAGKSLQLIFKYWVVSLVIMIIAIAIGQYFARPSVRRYNAGAVAMLHGSNVATAKEVCRQLQNSTSLDRTFSLAHKLNIPDSVAQNIVGISEFNIVDYLKDGSQDMIDFKRAHSLNDTLNLVMQDRFYVQVLTKKISQVPIVQEALLNYFNNNPTMRGEFEAFKLGLQGKIDVCNKEISRLDSLAKVTYFKDADKKISLENNRLIVGDQTKQLFYNDILNLHNIRSQTELMLTEFNQPMNFTSGLIVDPRPVNGRFKYLVYSILIGFLGGFVLTSLIENFNVIFNYLTNKK